MLLYCKSHPILVKSRQLEKEQRMKIDRRGPAHQSDLTLMNARRKEKKRMLTDAHKPKTRSDWVYLIDEMRAFYKNNDWAVDIDDYAISKGFAPYKIRKTWPNDEPLFQEYIQELYAYLKSRHNAILMKEGKFAQIINRERPLYNPDLAEYERAQESAAFAASQQIPQYQPLKETIKKEEK